MSDRQKQDVLFLPRWYPNRLDPQLGVFIRKHAEAVSAHVNVAVLYPQADPSMKQEVELVRDNKDGVDTILVYYRHRDGGGIARLQNLFSYFKAFRRGWKAYRTQHPYPSLIHVHVLLRPMVMAVLLTLKHRIPIILTEHWTGYVFGFFRMKHPAYRKLARLCLRRLKLITVVSPSLEVAMKESGLDHIDYRVLGNVVESSASTSTSSSSSVSSSISSSNNGKSIEGEGRKIILTVADLVERNKNVGGAIEAIQILAQERSDFEYHIIGGGPDEEVLRKKALESGLLDSVVYFYGRKDNDFVLEQLRQCHFLLVNSNVETFSVVTAEALAAGKPVVATRSGGPEHFLTEDCGLLIHPRKRDELLNALRHMLDHATDYDAEKMQDLVERKFSSEAIGKQLKDIYSEVLG